MARRIGGRGGGGWSAVKEQQVVAAAGKKENTVFDILGLRRRGRRSNRSAVTLRSYGAVYVNTRPSMSVSSQLTRTVSAAMLSPIGSEMKD